MDKEFNKIFATTLGYEGGVDKTMKGVVSNMGVTQTAYDAFNKRKNLPIKNVEGVSWGEARDIGYEDYYIDSKIDKLYSGRLKGAAFDYEYNSGGRKSIKAIQGIIGVKQDGKVGPKTQKALKEYIKKNGQDAIVENLLNEREQYLTDLTISNPQKYGKYTQGWANRIQKQRNKYLQPRQEVR